MNKAIPIMVAALMISALLFAGCTQPGTPAGGGTTAPAEEEVADLGVTMDDLGVSQGIDDQMDSKEAIPSEPAA